MHCAAPTRFPPIFSTVFLSTAYSRLSSFCPFTCAWKAWALADSGERSSAPSSSGFISGRWHIYFTHKNVFVPFKFESHLIFVSDLSPISGLISDEFVKKIFHQFGKIVTHLILDGCHRLTGKILNTIATSPSLRSVSLKWSWPFFLHSLRRAFSPEIFQLQVWSHNWIGLAQASSNSRAPLRENWPSRLQQAHWSCSVSRMREACTFRGSDQNRRNIWL